MAGLSPTIVFRSGVPSLTAVPIVRSSIILGKHPTCDIVVSNPFVSRQHAQVELRSGSAVIKDLSSKNGTFVNGHRIRSEPTELPDGAVIEFGRNQVLAEFHLAESTVTLDNISVSQSSNNDSSELVVDESARQVWVEGRPLQPPLTKKEFDILNLLATRRGQLCTHTDIARAGWPERGGAVVEETEIRQYIRRIRVRIDSAGSSNVNIVTLRGDGYRLDIDG